MFFVFFKVHKGFSFYETIAEFAVPLRFLETDLHLKKEKNAFGRNQSTPLRLNQIESLFLVSCN